MFANDMKIILLISNFSSIVSLNFGEILKLYFLGLNKTLIIKYVMEGSSDKIPYDNAVLAASLRLYSSFELKLRKGLNFKVINLFIIIFISENVIISNNLNGLIFFFSFLGFCLFSYWRAGVL